MVTEACVCGSTDYQRVYFGKREYWQRSWPAVSTDVEVWVCKQCNLKRTWPMPYTRESETLLYHSGKQNETPLDPASMAWNEMLTARANRALVKCIPLSPSTGRLLDIGCGSGLLVREALSLGWQAMGIDLDPVRIQRGQQWGIPNLFCGDPESMHFSDHEFAVVTLSHVLEHIVDIKGFLRQVWRILEPGGILIFEVPNYDSWTAAIMRQYPRRPWYGLCPHQHVWQMGPSGVKSIFALADILGVTSLFSLERCRAISNLDHGTPGARGKLLRLLLSPNAWLGRGDRLIGSARRLAS